MITAVYDENGTLLSVKIRQVEFEKDVPREINVDIEVSGNVAVFFWKDEMTPVSEKNLAILIGKNVPLDRKLEIFKRAKALRAEGTTVTIQPMRKNMKQQIEKLEAEGFKEFEKVYND